MWPSSWPPFLYPPPASVLVTAVSLVSLANGGLSELCGEHMAYSKFWHIVTASRGSKAGAAGALLPSRDGMLVPYAPALVAAEASFAAPGAVEGARAELLSAALAVHFLKRVLEALFVHRYSGRMPLATALTISHLLKLPAQHRHHDLRAAPQLVSWGLPDPTVDLLYPGVLIFAVGIAGNFYHRGKGYKIPRGGLFELATCPHYLFEIMVFFGFAMIAQTVYALSLASGTAVYLAGRSCATRRWCESKFEEFPARIKALVQYVL